ncbi:MAG: hypothetical protein IJF61_03160 [Clostridia bacterium]|nr:hypothetical protein [Clostridia bacterium]
MKINLEKYLKKFTNTKGLVIILLLGIGLLLLPDLLPQKIPVQPASENTLVSGNSNEYEKTLEKRLSSILSTVRGVSHVSVMITLEDCGEAYYVQNEAVDEKNSEDGSLSEKSLQADGTLALKTDPGGGQSPVLLKTGLPRISGVLITAKGVDNPTTKGEVVSAVRAVLNVSAHRVQVLPKS